MPHNARLQEAAGKPMRRDARSRARCLVPVEGWEEFTHCKVRSPVKNTTAGGPGLIEPLEVKDAGASKPGRDVK